MPNWTTNYLTILGDKEKVDECIEAFTTRHKETPRKSHDGDLIYSLPLTPRESFDAQEKGEPTYGWLNPTTNKFRFPRTDQEQIGIPKGWKQDFEEAFNHFPDFNKVIPQPENIFRGNLGRKEEEMCQKEGIPNWYDWNIANWGTKWNSSNCHNNGEEYVFLTAWCGVPEIIRAMSDKFPTLTFEYRCEHENGGGEYLTFIAGEQE